MEMKMVASDQEKISREQAFATAAAELSGSASSADTAMAPGSGKIRDTIGFLKQIYTHDRETLFGAMAPDFKLHSPGHNLIAGTYVGPEGFTEHVKHMQLLCDGSFEEELQDTFLANDRWGLVVHRMTAIRGSQNLDMWGFGLWRFDNGWLTDHWEAVGDQTLWDEFWS